jgi:hypothetical protein
MFSKVMQYGLFGIFLCLALGSYLNFLAERDAKMFKAYDACATLPQPHPDCNVH